jgi:acetyl esterase/lipase
MRLIKKPASTALRRLLVLGVAMFLGTGLTSGQQNSVRRAPKPVALMGVQMVRDLEYVPGGHERNRLDLYLPEKAARPLPVILYVHGGGWQGGDKSNGPALRFASKGYAVASMNYRFSQHATFPAQIYDCKAAVRWLRANARKYGLDADHIGAWGGSAGGHLVALLGTTAGVKELEGPGGNEEQSSRVQAVVDWFGPTDFLTVGAKETRTQLLGGDPQTKKEKALKASPMTYVSKDAAPFLIMHGDGDETVPIAQSETFAAALKKAGADATFVVIKGGKHGGALFTNAESMKLIEDFFARHLARATPAQP